MMPLSHFFRSQDNRRVGSFLQQERHTLDKSLECKDVLAPEKEKKDLLPPNSHRHLPSCSLGFGQAGCRGSLLRERIGAIVATSALDAL